MNPSEASGSWSGRPDLNRRPRGPKPRALARLPYAPVRRMVACARRWVKRSASLARRGWAGCKLDWTASALIWADQDTRAAEPYPHAEPGSPPHRDHLLG